MMLSKWQQELEVNGYTVIRNFCDDDTVQFLQNNALHPSTILKVNTNYIPSVISGTAFFDPNVLMNIPETTSIVADPRVLDVCLELLGPSFHLKFVRAYKVKKGYDFSWHTDNKDASGKNYSSKGVVFNLALSDTKTGGKFQIIRGSHKWSAELTYSNFDIFVAEKSRELTIDTLEYGAGDLIVFSEAVIHRPDPITKKGYSTLSLLWQVVNSEMGCERTLLNSHLPLPALELHEYFNIGRMPDYPLMPQGGITALPFGELVKLLLLAVSASPKVFFKSIKNFLPASFKIFIKKLLR